MSLKKRFWTFKHCIFFWIKLEVFAWNNKRLRIEEDILNSEGSVTYKAKKKTSPSLKLYNKFLGTLTYGYFRQKNNKR